MKIGMFTSGYQRNPIEDAIDYLKISLDMAKEMLYELNHNGYKKTATLELVTNYINEPRFYAKRTIDNMRSLMQQAGMD